MGYDAFISYSRKDQEILDQLRDDLRIAGLSVWTDEFLEPGTPIWEAEIESAIKDSSCLIVILSPDSYSSVWVRREITLADTVNLRIYPFLIRGEKKGDAVPLRLITSQWIDATSNYSDALKKLITAIRKHTNSEMSSEQLNVYQQKHESTQTMEDATKNYVQAKSYDAVSEHIPTPENVPPMFDLIPSPKYDSTPRIRTVENRKRRQAEKQRHTVRIVGTIFIVIATIISLIFIQEPFPWWQNWFWIVVGVVSEIALFVLFPFDS